MQTQGPMNAIMTNELIAGLSMASQVVTIVQNRTINLNFSTNTHWDAYNRDVTRRPYLTQCQQSVPTHEVVVEREENDPEVHQDAAHDGHVIQVRTRQADVSWEEK